jgi:chitodextrinase
VPTSRLCMTATGKLHALPCPRPKRALPAPATTTPVTTTSAPPPTTTQAPPPPTTAADTTPPSVPGGLSVSNVSTSTLQLNWAASSDNVGVTGYDAFLNGGLVGTVSVLSASYSGLACGTSYTLSVDARDAAGNVSDQASAQAATSACPPPPPSVSVSKGPSHTVTGCTISACAYIQVALSNFPGGSHTVQCYDDTGGGAWYTYTTSATVSDVCVYGYPGHQVWVTVDGVESNHYTW